MVKQVIRLTGKAWQVFDYLALLAKQRGEVTLKQIIEETNAYNKMD